MLGGLVLGFIEAFGTEWFGGQWRDVFAFAVLILFLTLRPTGILGERVTERMYMSENVDTTMAPLKIRSAHLASFRLFESKQLGWIALAIALLAPFVTATPYALNVMTTAAIFVLLASGLNIVVGYCGLLDLGYIAFMAVGAYTAGIVSKSFGLPLIFTIPVVLVMTVLAGLIIGAPTLRLRSDYWQSSRWVLGR